MSHPNAQSYVLPGNPMWREYFSYPPLRPPMAYSHTITYVPLYPQVTSMPSYPQVTSMPTPPVSQFAYRTIPLRVHQ
jgi:hypothetical protein